MGDVSEASLLDYIYSSGGKVKNSDLLKTFKSFVRHNDLQLRAKYRDDFKLIIDRIAVCKTENGEKYLILKKKYRQLMQERESESAASEQGVKVKKPQVEWCSGPAITVTDAQDTEETENMSLDQPAVSTPEPLSEENPETTDVEDELEKDSGSKSESEQDEESSGSVGSASVALDPIEKEWIYSAACGDLSHLSQLLKQDASLANKKTALHWAAKHGKEDMATVMANAGAEVNIKDVSAKEDVRDYSGHLASHYLKIRKAEGSSQLNAGYHSPAQVTERRHRKITSLFHSRKKWGSAEDLAPIPEERNVPHQLIVPAFRTRKFSR
ncbi:Ankyrin repeat domain-containing protein SOWAHB [Bagarius yarrelli]|uniref:Ankyrin repeat domain-containing protein SOWAHB n=1 Tax=Bagarius yarrelli TaxID=175774 RepID=A0A556U0L9_BAGYA|nr:Ankyrin repeat domain-containing protein SOWAHB [Bagarius yarrelli]